MSLYAKKHNNCPTCTCTKPIDEKMLSALEGKTEDELLDMLTEKVLKNDAAQILANKHQDDSELLELIYKDLKMRSVDGVVDISNFIWERLSNRINNS